MAATSLLPGLARYRHGTPGRPFRLSRIDPGEQPCGSDDKDADRAAVDELARDLDALQNLFWADKRHKLLVVLQGLDASGKDGTLRHVFGRMSPLGVHAVGWGVPTDAERAHDFLWRIHQRVPAAGEIVVFNRSHYEDVLVPLVGGTLTPAQARLRYAHINDFERMLSDTGTVICKFMLHISKDEQRQRLQERIDNPTSAGSSTSATWTCAVGGTTTSVRTRRPSARRARRGRRGPSCRRTPRRTAT
jgi:polyphosphate kinase 2 (PPK2 family)